MQIQALWCVYILYNRHLCILHSLKRHENRRMETEFFIQFIHMGVKGIYPYNISQMYRYARL